MITSTEEQQKILSLLLSTLTPEQLAENFWTMTSEDQAKFFNHLSEIADFKFPFQLQNITEENGLSLAGRRVMSSIGEYSHWGLSCTLSKG